VSRRAMPLSEGMAGGSFGPAQLCLAGVSVPCECTPQVLSAKRIEGRCTTQARLYTLAFGSLLSANGGSSRNTELTSLTRVVCFANRCRIQ